VERILLASLVQSGANRIELGSKLDSDKHLPPFLSRRITYGSSRDWGELLTYVLSLMPDSPATVSFNEHLNMTFLPFFLVALLRAAQRRTNMVCITVLPDAEICGRLLPTQLAIPINTLLSNIRSHSAHLPLPRSTITVSDVGRFREIMTSQSYREYEDDHGKLDYRAHRTDTAFRRIERTAKALCDRFPHFLTLKDSMVSLLPITSRLIDATFGKLPGTLATISTRLLGGYLRNERRIVIYRLDRLRAEINRRRLRELSEGRGLLKP
jgi:hypothetical protein